MLKLVYSVLVSLISMTLLAQVPTDQDCLGAIPVCQDLYVQDNAYNGSGNFPNELGFGFGCNFSETNSVWYTFSIQEDGFLEFILTPVNGNDDYDWALFNLTDASCQDIGTDASLEVSCNSYGDPGNDGATGISTAMGGVGNSNGPGNTNGPIFNADLPVLAGEVYALLVMDWSGTPTGYTLDFSNTSAGLYDDEGPVIVSAEVLCDNTIDIVFDEPVLCGTLDDVNWELIFADGIVVQAAGLQSDCLNDEGFTTSVTLEYAESIVPVASETLVLRVDNLTGDVTDFCGNPIELEDLEFDFTSEPIEAIVQVLDSDCDSDNGQVQVDNVLFALAPVTYDLSGTVQTTPLFENLAPGDYTLTVTDAEGCEDQLELSISEPSPPVITAVTSSDVICGQGCSGTISITAADVLSYSIDGGMSTQPDGDFDQLCAGSYQLEVDAGSNCTAQTMVTVGTVPAVEAQLELEPTSASVDEPWFTIINSSEGEVEAQWIIGNYGEQTTHYGDTLYYTHEPAQPGTYELKLITTDTAGCTSEAHATFTLTTDFSLYVPNSFTPNGDGINDRFFPVIEGAKAERYRFEIFDRWGRMVFCTENPAEFWHGDVAGGEFFAPDGMYQYQISLSPESQSGSQVYSGVVTLIR